MKSQFIELNDGNRIPQLGFGLWQVPDEDTESIVQIAIDAGYRSLDGAQVYQNESGLGRAIAASSCPRSELFVTTKIWNSEQGRDSTLRSFDLSMQKLQLETLDLLLIHWPAPKRGLYVETWKAMVELKKSKRVRSIGVSNFYPEHLEEIIQASGVVPVLNQVELHPRFQQSELKLVHKKHGIKTEAWSPLGQGKLIADPVIAQLALKHQKSPAQIILRWHLQEGHIVIPKSITPERIRQNISVFDFELDLEDTEIIRKMDRSDGRIGPDPLTAEF